MFGLTNAATRKLAIAGAAAMALVLITAPASATTVLTDFNNFNLSGTYGSWAGGFITSGPTSYHVEAVGGFGGGFFDMDPNIDATGETTIEFTYTGNPSNTPNGLVLTLVDEDLTTHNWAWYGVSNGTNTLTASLSSPNWVSGNGSVAGLDLAQLSFFHIQSDPLPGTGNGITDVSFEHLQLTPEPASLALLGLGACALLRRRQPQTA
jgi:hypothetical protein